MATNFRTVFFWWPLTNLHKITADPSRCATLLPLRAAVAAPLLSVLPPAASVFGGPAAQEHGPGANLGICIILKLDSKKHTVHLDTFIDTFSTLLYQKWRNMMPVEKCLNQLKYVEIHLTFRQSHCRIFHLFLSWRWGPHSRPNGGGLDISPLRRPRGRWFNEFLAPLR